ncbi:unnamed protein product, partial [Iphiclides podalirius]
MARTGSGDSGEGPGVRDWSGGGARAPALHPALSSSSIFSAVSSFASRPSPAPELCSVDAGHAKALSVSCASRGEALRALAGAEGGGEEQWRGGGAALAEEEARAPKPVSALGTVTVRPYLRSCVRIRPGFVATTPVKCPLNERFAPKTGAGAVL